MNTFFTLGTLFVCLIFCLNQFFLLLFFIFFFFCLPLFSYSELEHYLVLTHHPALTLPQDGIYTSFLFERCSFGRILGARLQLLLKLKHSFGASSEMWAEPRAIMSGVAHSRPEPRTASMLRLLDGKPTCLSKKKKSSPLEAWLFLGTGLNWAYIIYFDKVNSKCFGFCVHLCKIYSLCEVVLCLVYSIRRHQERRAILTPILTDFSLRVTAAPAIIFSKSVSPDCGQAEVSIHWKLSVFTARFTPLKCQSGASIHSRHRFHLDRDLLVSDLISLPSESGVTMKIDIDDIKNHESLPCCLLTYSI